MPIISVEMNVVKHSLRSKLYRWKMYLRCHIKLSQVVSNCCTSLPRSDVGKRGQNLTLTCQQIKISFLTGQIAKQKYSPSHKKQIVSLGHKLLYKLKKN